MSESPQKRQPPLADRIAAERPRLMRYAKTMLRGHDGAEDLTQTVLLRALRRQHLFEEGSDLRAWLFTIMHNERVNQVRKSVRENTTAVDPGAPLWSRIPTATDIQYFRVLYKELWREINNLPAEQRRVVIMVGFEGEDYEQAAEFEDVPLGTIRSRLSRGRNALRIAMGDAPEDDFTEDELVLLRRWG